MLFFYWQIAFEANKSKVLEKNIDSLILHIQIEKNETKKRIQYICHFGKMFILLPNKNGIKDF